MGQLALHGGPVDAVVGPPGRGSRWRRLAACSLASCGWMVTVRPARLLVQADASGQTAQARPKRATPPPWPAGPIGTDSLAGQVTLPWSRSMRNWA